MNTIANATSQLSREAARQNKLKKINAKKCDDDKSNSPEHNATLFSCLGDIQKAIASAKTKVEVVDGHVPGIDKLLRVLVSTIESSIYPLVRRLDKKSDIDLRTFEKNE